MINRSISEEIRTLIVQGNLIKQHVEKDLRGVLEEKSNDIEYCRSEFFRTLDLGRDFNAINMDISYRSIVKYDSVLKPECTFNPNSIVFLKYLIDYLNENKEEVLLGMSNMMFRDAVIKKKQFDAELVKLEIELKNVAPLLSKGKR